MLPIASVISQEQMRRSLVGALATDPVVPERVRRTRRPARTDAAERARAELRVGADGTESPYPHASEGASTA